MSGTITQSQFTANLKRYYSFYTGGFVAFVIIVGILEQMGVPNKILGYIFLFATIAVRRHRLHVEDGGRRRVLRRRPARARPVQRHGDRRRLDVGRQLHRHGRHALPVRLRRPRLRAGLDRRLLPGGASCWRPTCASSASSRFRTSSAPASAAICRASSASSSPSPARSPT
jgi:hypothetical protein